jgi:uncharacterized protein YndB with AHSA1/START domain
MTNTDTPAPTADSPELGELTIVRRHAAPVELMFDVMTTPEHLTHFWGPVGTTTPVDGIVVDLRPGGVFETRMVADDGSGEHVMRAVYVEVDRPHRLSWTETDVEGGLLTTITFVAVDDTTTEVTTHQTNVPAMCLTAEAQAGFRSSFDRCDAYVATLVG